MQGGGMVDAGMGGWRDGTAMVWYGGGMVGWRDGGVKGW